MVRRIKAKRVLELRAEDMTGRAIALAEGMSRKSVLAVFDAADKAGVGREGHVGRSDAEVYAFLFPGRGEHESVFVQPDWEGMHKELAKVGVTLKLLHGKYVDGCAVKKQPSMGYDRFCKAYVAHTLITGAASRVGHKAGQTIEVDWSGPTMQLIDPVTGETSRVICSWRVCRFPGMRSSSRRWICAKTPGCWPTWRCLSGSADRFPGLYPTT